MSKLSQSRVNSTGGRRQSIVDQYGEKATNYASMSDYYDYGRRKSHVGRAPSVPAGTLTQTDRNFSTVANQNADFNELTTEAEKQAARQANMTLWEGLRTYPTAAGWSILLASTIIMEGYDTSLIGSLFAYQTFAKKYDGVLVDGKYQIPTSWQTGLQNGSSVGSMVGLFANGFLCDRFGYKKVMIGSLAFMTAVVFIPFFAPNIIVLEVGQCLCGIPWGIFQTLAITYASEVCPTALRGYLTTYANICWVIGQIIASGVLKGFLSNTTEWSYRIPFAIQWAFPVPIMIGVMFAPESPWWLVRHDRFDDAMNSVRRLQSKSEGEETVAASVSVMRLTNEQEKAITKDASFWDCFKGSDLRRTEIACATWAVQNMCGSAFMGYSTYFYEQAGLSTSNSFTFTMIQYILGLLGTVGAWALMSRFGRRTLYISGLVILFCILIAIGGLGFAKSSGAAWAAGSLLLVFTLVYDLTVGPVCYAIVAEISSTRLRTKTVVLSRITYNACSLLNNSLLPLQLNPLAWNWGAKDGLFWGGITSLCILWCVFRLPESKDRSYAELNLLFENKVKAWRFAGTKVDAFRGQSVAVVGDVEEETDTEVEGDGDGDGHSERSQWTVVKMDNGGGRDTTNTIENDERKKMKLKRKLGW